MLDFWSWWFGVFQSVGGVATAIALFFVGYQMKYTKVQVETMRTEQSIRLRPWIYRDPIPEPNPPLQNYQLIEDPDLNQEYCVRIPFHNQGGLHSTSLTYYHQFTENLNEEERFDNEKLTRIKEETKTKYKEIGDRVIVPSNKFGKRFHLAQNKLKRYNEQNPIDNAILDNYKNGSKIYLVIFLSYTYQPEKKGEIDKTGEYLGILKLEKKSTYRNDQWTKEYVN